MAIDTLTIAARDAAARAGTLLAEAALTGDAWSDGLLARDALTDAAESVYDARQAFAEELVGFLRFVAREGEVAALVPELRHHLSETPIEQDAGVAALYEAALVAALAIVTVRHDYPARQDASAAREAFAELAEPVVERTGHMLGPEAHSWLQSLVGDTVVILSKLAADRVPLVRVESGISMPSTRLAFDLYGDPTRAVELVERNDVTTPAFMPVLIEALAS